MERSSRQTPPRLLTPRQSALVLRKDLFSSIVPKVGDPNIDPKILYNPDYGDYKQGTLTLGNAYELHRWMV